MVNMLRTLRASGLSLFVAAYLSLFLVAGLVLFTSILNLKPVDSSEYRVFESENVNKHLWGIFQPYSSAIYFNINESDTKIDLTSTNALLDLLSHRNSGNGKLSFVDSGSLFWPRKKLSDNLLDCSALLNITDIEFVASGWTKAVYKGKLGEQKLAVKTVNMEGHDVKECLQNGGIESECYMRAAAKLLKELILLSELEHDNVVKVAGWCLSSAGGVALLTELGTPLDAISLLQQPWEARLRVAFGTAKLLRHLATSPLGSVALRDLRRQQLVLSLDGELRLTDVDDAAIDDGTGRATSERSNVLGAGKHLVAPFLPPGAPPKLRQDVSGIINAYSSGAPSSTVLSATDKLVKKYASGSYRKQPLPTVEELGFQVHRESDIPGHYDYHCLGSYSAVACVMSVKDESEAAEMCLQDLSCRAVVISNDTTWTGRNIAVFKNGSAGPSRHAGYTLLVQDD